MTTHTPSLSEVELECNRLREELKKTQYLLQCVDDVVHSISSLMDLNEILQIVAGKARQLIGAQKLIIPIVDKDRLIYTYMAASGVNAELVLGQSFPINIGMCGWSISNRRSLFFGAGSRELMGQTIVWTQGMESVLLVPLLSHGNIIGGLSGLGKEGGGSFTAEDQSLLELFSWHISIAIENAIVFKQLNNQKSQSQSILDNSPAVIYIKDVAGKYLLINKQFEWLSKFSNDSIKGKTDFDVFPHDIAEKFIKNDHKVLETKAPVEFEETVLQNGKEHVYISIKFPLFDINNKIYAICGISTDITERRKTESVLRRAQKMEAIGQLSGGIAHDFNNQLGVVLGYLDMIGSVAGKQADVMRMLETATRATLRCTDLTRQLLSFSRKQISDDRKLNLPECIDEMKMLFMRSLTPRIQIEYEVQADLWPVRSNKGELQDALLNLVLNANDAMSAGGRLKIMACNAYLDENQIGSMQNIKVGAYVKLTIVDTGSGMTPEVLDKIYEPFFTTKPTGKGTGLGMAMVYGFIKRNNGQISITSKPGLGTTVNIYLPRLLEADAVAVDSVQVPGTYATGNETVLVVDDEPAMLDLTVQYLKNLGYATLQAANALAALDIVKSTPDIHLLLTDVLMPEMNGYQLAQQVQTLRPDIRVLLVSGFVSGGIMDAQFKRYQSNIIMKPYRQEILANKVREILDRDSRHE
jgi:PAS domain S-box-containing protein